MSVDREEIGEDKTAYMMRCLATMTAVQAIIEARFGMPSFNSGSDLVTKIMKDSGIDWDNRTNMTEFELLKVFHAVASAIAAECEEALNE